jgi:hypothetical protein
VRTAGRALAILAALSVPLGAMVACATTSSTTSTAPVGSAGVSNAASSVTVDDAGSIADEIAAYSAATPVASGSASAGAGATAPKIHRAEGDPVAASPNGKCRSGSSPTPEFRAAAQAAAQGTLICYEYALKRDAPSPAHLEVMLDVDEDGKLRDAAVLSDDFADDKMRTCTVRKLREVAQFPPPKTGCGIVSRLPLTFLRADGGL